MPTILVPAPPASAFNKNRPISDLLAHQLKHFQHMEAKLPNALQSNMAPRDLLTENGAAQYIAHITRGLLSVGQSARPAAISKLVRPSGRSSRTLAIAASADPSPATPPPPRPKPDVPRSPSEKSQQPNHAGEAGISKRPKPGKGRRSKP